MVLVYTDKLSEANLFVQTYLSSYKEKSVDLQALHLFNNSGIYFEKYPQKFRIIHANKKQRSQLFFVVDRFFYVNEKEHKEVYSYVLHLINSDFKLIFFSLNEKNSPRPTLKVAGMINSQIAAINKIVDTINKKYGDLIVEQKVK